jgi:hypothetical protein
LIRVVAGEGYPGIGRAFPFRQTPLRASLSRAADDGAANYVYRFAPLVGIYCGTVEVFRNHDRAVRARTG